jgi:hypothetical protein
MPTHDGVRVHDDQGCAPIPPRIGEQHPKESISVAVCMANSKMLRKLAIRYVHDTLAPR